MENSGMLILIWGEVGIGKIPHLSLMVIFPFHTSWFSRRGENKNPTTSGEATSGRICFLPQVLNHKWGMEILPWVTNGEFYQSLLLLRWGLTFLYCKWKWSILTLRHLAANVLRLTWQCKNDNAKIPGRNQTLELNHTKIGRLINNWFNRPIQFDWKVKK